VPDLDRETRIHELRRLVENGEYKIDPIEVAAAIVRSKEPDLTEFSPAPHTSEEFSANIQMLASKTCS
jgi:hypothetical protein